MALMERVSRDPRPLSSFLTFPRGDSQWLIQKKSLELRNTLVVFVCFSHVPGGLGDRMPQRQAIRPAASRNAMLGKPRSESLTYAFEKVLCCVAGRSLQRGTQGARLLLWWLSFDGESAPPLG